MRPAAGLPVALIAILAACSSEPAATALDGAPDTPAVDAVDAADTVDVDAPADARDAAVGVDAVDAAVVDVPGVEVAVDVADDAPDAAATDAPTLDAPEVADVQPEDTAPADAGPVTWPLDPPPSMTMGHVLYQRTPCPEPCEGPADAIALNVSCARTGSRLNFDLRGCTFGPSSCLQITGAFPDYRNATGATVAIVGGVTNQGRNIRIAPGTTSGARQSFHVQFSATSGVGIPGVTGIHGRTVDPSLGDLWLLGCELR